MIIPARVRKVFQVDIIAKFLHDLPDVSGVGGFDFLGSDVVSHVFGNVLFFFVLSVASRLFPGHFPAQFRIDAISSRFRQNAAKFQVAA